MAAASPTPLPGYGASRITRKPSTRMITRRDSPLGVLGMSQGFTDNAPMLQSIHVGDDSDDDIAPAPSLSKYAEEIIAHNGGPSPEKRAREPKLRITRETSAEPTIPQDSITPAPSVRGFKRVQLRGAPMRRQKRTPQSEDEVLPASQDQENMPASIIKAEKDTPVEIVNSIPRQHREDRPPALAPLSVNTPLRPAPPPPPRMSVLETATAAGGAATTKTKRRKNHVLVNNTVYSQMGKIGRGGSSEVYRVMAENGKMFALKRVKLGDADESAIRGYKGEIELLKKLKDVERVVRLYDYEVLEEKQVLSVLMEIGESDLSKTLRQKLDPDDAQFDPTFTRYYWKEMLECVQAVHDHDIVHSDLKPANFLLVQGRLKLIDFGIANAIDIENTVNVHRDSHVGTPNYMSPESLSDTNADARHSGSSDRSPHVKDMKLGKPSDVWSLGCILYQMVYGRPPFAHIPNQLTRVMAIVNPSIEISIPHRGIGDAKVPPSLRSTLRRCLNRDPAKRPTIPEMLGPKDAFLNPDDDEDLRIPQELLGQIIQRVADRFRDGNKAPPTDEEIRQYPASFYAKIRDLLDEA